MSNAVPVWPQIPKPVSGSICFTSSCHPRWCSFFEMLTFENNAMDRMDTILKCDGGPGDENGTDRNSRALDGRCGNPTFVARIFVAANWEVFSPSDRPSSEFVPRCRSTAIIGLISEVPSRIFSNSLITVSNRGFVVGVVVVEWFACSLSFQDSYRPWHSPRSVSCDGSPGKLASTLALLLRR